MIAIIALMVVGLLWVDATERGKGVVELALVATPLPLAVLLRRRREWLIAVVTYIVVSTAAAAYLFLDWLGQSERTGLTVDRYGGLYDERAARLTDQNVTATHLAFGVLLIAILWLVPDLGIVARRWRIACAACLPELLAGLVLSGSRGGTLSILGAVTVLAAFTSLRRSLPLRTNLLGAIGLVGIAALMLLAPNPVSHRLALDAGTARGSIATGDPTRDAVNNIADAVRSAIPTPKLNRSDTQSFGGRTETWRAALKASGSSRGMFLVGTGTGGADHAVAAANPNLVIAKVGERGVIRANAHSSYFYWLVSFGIVGVIVAAVAVGTMAVFAVQNDWHWTYGGGTAMLAFFLLTSVTLIAMRLEITSIAVSALTLGYILPRPPAEGVSSSAESWVD
jgi:hypothetical protein